MKCKKCSAEMKEVDRKVVMSEIDEDMTDGQMADYFAAQESGDVGDFGYAEIKFKCLKCGYEITTTLV
jgi:DNA-directed RNA polymerase subunit M/transcription elongation factor TFIIS